MRRPPGSTRNEAPSHNLDVAEGDDKVLVHGRQTQNAVLNVGDLAHAVGSDQHVARVQVAVGNALVVEVLERLDQASSNRRPMYAGQ